MRPNTVLVVLVAVGAQLALAALPHYNNNYRGATIIRQPIIHQQPQQQQLQHRPHQRIQQQRVLPNMQQQQQHLNYPASQSPPSQPVPSRQPESGCVFPPELWCDSAWAAQQCGVQAHCDSMKRRPLRLTLIFEALCPYCQKFIANQLGTIISQYRNVEVELVPWGNSRRNWDGSITCNHGKKECDANRFMGCVIDTLKPSNDSSPFELNPNAKTLARGRMPARHYNNRMIDVPASVQFIVCFERALGSTHVEQAIQQCQAFIRTQYRQIRLCYDGDAGRQLQLAAEARTNAARPHQILEVPYLLVNDYSASVDANNFLVANIAQLLPRWTKQYSRL